MMQYSNGSSAIIGLASNVRGGANPSYGVLEFKEMYPQFFVTDDEQDKQSAPDDVDDSDIEPAASNENTKSLIPLAVLEAYIDLAHASIKKTRYREAWKICIGLFIAHFVTLYLETMVDSDGDSSAVAKAGQSGGLTASKAVDGVSVSYDYSQVVGDLAGWAGWKATEFGVQLATYAKMFSMGGMYIR